MPMWLHDYINPLESGRYETWYIANSNKVIMPKFWRKISLWIFNKYFRTHHSKIEMKVYWLSQELNCHKKNTLLILESLQKKNVLMKVCSINIAIISLKFYNRNWALFQTTDYTYNCSVSTAISLTVRVTRIFRIFLENISKIT